MNANDVQTLLKRKHRACYLKLFTYYQQIDVKTIVEIGVFQGKNAQVLREMFPNAHLYLIDPWAPSHSYLASGSAVGEDPTIYHKALIRVKKLFKNDPQVTLIHKCSNKALYDVPNLLDLVFIDANHAYSAVKEDILLWKKKVRVGGVISGHNYGRIRLPGVKQAVNEIFGNKFVVGQDEVWAHVKERTGEDSNL